MNDVNAVCYFKVKALVLKTKLGFEKELQGKKNEPAPVVRNLRCSTVFLVLRHSILGRLSGSELGQFSRCCHQVGAWSG